VGSPTALVAMLPAALRTLLQPSGRRMARARTSETSDVRTISRNLGTGQSYIVPRVLLARRQGL
jgi:hypothetical protein